MHAEMKKNPSRDTCSRSAAPEPTLAAAGAKYRTECVPMTPACLIGRHAGSRAHRQGRRPGPGRRAGGGSRRLPGQAVRPARAAGPGRPGDRADQDRVRPPGDPAAQRRAGAQLRPDPRASVGFRRGSRVECPSGLRGLPAAQARGGGPPAAGAQRARRRLRHPGRSVTATRRRLHGSLMLRTRFTLAVAAAVAAVTLVITAVAFLVVRADLQNQVRNELGAQAAAVLRLARHYHGHVPADWVPPHSDRFGASSPYAQVVTAQGAVWAPAGDTGLLARSVTAAQVAAGQRGPTYTETTLAGVRAMVLTTPLAPGLALQLAVPLNTVDLEVASVGATLALLSVIGVALAALAGGGVARAGLAPVARLAAVAEQVTATGDPGRRVDVDRADELGRLATSFN